MVINTNLSAQVSANNLNRSQEMLSKSLSRLSSGSKIVTPADDAGGLAVASRLDAQVQRLDAASANVANAVSFTQTQDGYLSKIAQALDRMSQLSLMAQDATKTDSDRALYNDEFAQLGSYISSASDKNFNGVPLFSASTLAVTIDSEGSTMNMAGINLGATAYVGAIAATIDTGANAVAALAQVKAAMDQIARDRASVGAYQSRLTYTSEQISVSKQNLSAASSRIQDVDVANESTEYARYNILVQSGTAMLAQANQLPQSVLKLLQ
jgi:flagellin